MPDPESTHEAAEKTERGEPLKPPAEAVDEPKVAEEGEGPARQVQPDGR